MSSTVDAEHQASGEMYASYPGVSTLSSGDALYGESLPLLESELIKVDGGEGDIAGDCGDFKPVKDASQSCDVGVVC